MSNALQAASRYGSWATMDAARLPLFRLTPASHRVKEDAGACRSSGQLPLHVSRHAELDGTEHARFTGLGGKPAAGFD